jgi:fructose-specific phosphotransferase system component IIB
VRGVPFDRAEMTATVARMSVRTEACIADIAHTFTHAERLHGEALRIETHAEYTQQSAGVKFGLLPERQTNLEQLAREIRVAATNRDMK